MLKLTTADKKIWSRVCDSPYWEQNFKPSLKERLVERQINATKQLETEIHPYLRQQFPNMSDKAIHEMFYDLGRFMDAQDFRMGIARRVWLDDPAEIARFTAYAARTHWLREGYRTGQLSVPGAYVLESIAIGDMAFVKKSLETYSNEASSHAFLAFLLGKIDDTEKALRLLKSKKSTQSEIAVDECLWGLLQNDATRFLAGLEGVRDGTRKVRGTTDPEYRLISVQLHGLYELALERIPELVVGWDVEQALPWDKGLYHWCRSGQPPISKDDFEGLDDDFVSTVLTLPKLKWWDDVCKKI